MKTFLLIILVYVATTVTASSLSTTLTERTLWVCGIGLVLIVLVGAIMQFVMMHDSEEDIEDQLP
jgi:hypothetical protein